MVTCLARRRFLLLLLALAVVAGSVASGQARAADDSGLIDINRAGSEELQELPGVGPSLARKIVEFREKNGPYQSVDELLKIRGIGEKSLERFRHLVTVGKASKKS